MIVRRIAEGDFEQAGRLMREFALQLPGIGKYASTAEEYSRLLKEAEAHGAGICVVAVFGERIVGVLSILVSELKGFSSVKMAQEMCFFIVEGHRGGSTAVRMVRHAEHLAKDAGAKFFTMALEQSHSPQGTEKFYERLGFTRSEVMVMKEV